jgi:hypothetical protein
MALTLTRWIAANRRHRCALLPDGTIWSRSSKRLDNSDADEQKRNAAEAHARNFTPRQAEPAIAIDEE